MECPKMGQWILVVSYLLMLALFMLLKRVGTTKIKSLYCTFTFLQVRTREAKGRGQRQPGSAAPCYSLRHQCS